MLKAPKAVVLLSCGLDSPTALALMQEQGFDCYALTIDYQQRNDQEIARSREIATQLGVTQHRVIQLEIGSWGGSALTDTLLATPHTVTAGIPITYVPARNTIFLAAAMGWAEVLGAMHLAIGCNRVDYQNYPDCRPDFLMAFANLANLGTKAGRDGERFIVHAPLLNLNKAEIIREALRLRVNLALTQSCYDPTPAGESCGQCNACEFRHQGFTEAGEIDPAL